MSESNKPWREGEKGVLVLMGGGGVVMLKTEVREVLAFEIFIKLLLHSRHCASHCVGHKFWIKGCDFCPCKAYSLVPFLYTLNLSSIWLPWDLPATWDNHITTLLKSLQPWLVWLRGLSASQGACKRQLIDLPFAHWCFSPSVSSPLPLSLK